MEEECVLILRRVSSSSGGHTSLGAGGVRRFESRGGVYFAGGGML